MSDRTLHLEEVYPGSVIVIEQGEGYPTHISAFCRRAWGNEPEDAALDIIFIHEDDCALHGGGPRCTCPPPVIHASDCSLLSGARCDCVDEDLLDGAL